MAGSALRADTLPKAICDFEAATGSSLFWWRVCKLEQHLVEGRQVPALQREAQLVPDNRVQLSHGGRQAFVLMQCVLQDALQAAKISFAPSLLAKCCPPLVPTLDQLRLEPPRIH